MTISRYSLDLLYCILGVLACLQICVLHVLACLNLLVSACLDARVFSMRACFMSLRDHKSYMLAVSNIFRAYVLGILVWQVFDSVLNALPRGHSKSTLLRKAEGSSRKKWWKMTQGEGAQPKNFCRPFFLMTQFSLTCFSLIGSNNITVTNNNKHPKGYMCLWDNYTNTCKAS